MRPGERVQLMMEAPEETLRLIRVCGPLDRAAAACVLRLVDAQLLLHRSGLRTLTDVVVDLEGASSFEPGGLESLRHLRHSAGRHGIAVHLAGCASRSHLLPLRARTVLTEFDTFPTAEVAVSELTRATAQAAEPEPAVMPDLPKQADAPTTGGSLVRAPRRQPAVVTDRLPPPAPVAPPSRTRGSARPAVPLG